MRETHGHALGIHQSSLPIGNPAWLIILAVLAVLTGARLPHALVSGEVAYFRFDIPPYPEQFVFQTTDPAVIEQARRILDGKQPNRIIMGRIFKAPASYNRPWHYHLDPASIEFAENAVEACDATIRYVEEHLDEVGGTLLPGGVWCPWASRCWKKSRRRPPQRRRSTCRSSCAMAR